MLPSYVKLIGLLFFGVIFVACENDMQAVNEALSKEHVSKETAEDIVLLYSDSAQLKVQVSGPMLVRHVNKREPREEFPEGIRVEFYNQNQIAESWLTAKYAIRYKNNKTIVAQDSVVLYTAKKDTIRTSELIWDEGKGIVFTDKFVRITNPERTINGYGFKTNQDFTVYEINAIEGELEVESLENELKEIEN
jgi:LPS export ABC transporter protein LptC